MTSLNIQYGYIDRYGKRHIGIPDEKEFFANYRLQSPEELEKSKLGVCWDQVEWEREAFAKESCQRYLTPQTVYIELGGGNSHTFLVVRRDNMKWYWFEHSYGKYRGINGPYDSVIAIVQRVITCMRDDPESGTDESGKNVAYATVYTKPTYGISCQSMMNHCRAGTPIAHGM